MTLFVANSSMYIFSVIVIAIVLLYFAYAVFNRAGLKVSSTIATVTGKQFNPSSNSYYTNIVAGRAYTQSQEAPETYALTLNVGNEATVGLVSKGMYDIIQVNDQVTVKFRRTRFSHRLEVVEVAK